MILNTQTYPEDADLSVSTPIVILHGLFGNWENWRSPQKALAKNAITIGLDLRNHGQSPHADTMDYAPMAEDVADTLNDLKVNACHLIGHSMGGKVALALTSMASVNIRSLVVVDIAPRRYEGQHHDILSAMSQIQPGALASRKDADEQMAKHVGDMMTRQFLLKNLVRNRTNGGAGYQWTLNLSALTVHYEKLLEPPPMADHFERPTLIIRGSESDYVTDEDLALYHHWADELRSETILGAGHWPHASHGAEVIKLLEDFYT